MIIALASPGEWAMIVWAIEVLLYFEISDFDIETLSESLDMMKLPFEMFVIHNMNPKMRFPTMWYVWLAKAQTSLRICAVWLEPLLVTWIFYEC